MTNSASQYLLRTGRSSSSGTWLVAGGGGTVLPLYCFYSLAILMLYGRWAEREPQFSTIIFLLENIIGHGSLLQVLGGCLCSTASQSGWILACIGTFLPPCEPKNG